MRIWIVLCFALAPAIAGAASADDCALAWVVNSCGGERMLCANRVCLVSVGQLTIGENACGQRMAALGVLSAEQPAPLLVGSPGQAKVQADGTRLALPGVVVTTDPGAFSDRVYAQAPVPAAAGIALVGGLGQAADVQEGSRVNVVGGISTLNGERVMLNPMVAELSEGDPPGPLEMINRSAGGGAFGVPPLGQRGVLGGKGLNNVGLFVRSTGMVIDNSHAEYILINDGSLAPFWETGLRVSKTNLSPVPGIGSYVAVSGISGVRVRGSVLDALLRPRKAGDLDVLVPAETFWSAR